MKREDARPVLELLAGYWVNPVMTKEEVTTWLRELASPSMRITVEEATTAISAASHQTEANFRPRPGQLVAMVQALRRRRALDRPAQRIPEASEIDEECVEARARVLEECRQVLSGARSAARDRSQQSQLTGAST